MNETITITCPNCFEPWVVEPEPASEPIEYVEDCPVCCRPAVIRVEYSPRGSFVTARAENE